MNEDKDFSVDDMLALWKEGSWDECWKRSQIVNCDMYGWEYAEEDDFTQDHKYQHAQHVIRHIASGRCFSVSVSRSGSYHSDWYYTYDSEPVEVKQVEKVTVVKSWVEVK